MNVIAHHVEALKLTPNEKKTVLQVQARMDEIHEMFAGYQNRGRAGIRDARGRAAVEPTRENLRALAEAVVFEAHAANIAAECKIALKPALNAAADVAKPVALRLLDDLEKATKQDLETHKKTLAASPLAEAAESGAAERAVAGALNWISQLRNLAESECGAMHVIFAELGVALD